MLIQGLGGKRASTEMINTSAGEHTRPTWSFEMSLQHTTRLSQNEKVLEKAESDMETVLTRGMDWWKLFESLRPSTCRVSYKNKGEREPRLALTMFITAGSSFAGQGQGDGNKDYSPGTLLSMTKNFFQQVSITNSFLVRGRISCPLFLLWAFLDLGSYVVDE